MSKVCDACHRVIVDEGSGNSPGDHDPAYHVAQAYHFPVTIVQKRRCGEFSTLENLLDRSRKACVSCGKDWPCPTIQEYS